MEEYLFNEETYKIIGICMEVHNQLGAGFLEIVYKDALELEFKNNDILFEREKEYVVNYKGTILKHKFYADFIVYDNIILEIKGIKSIPEESFAQCINYLKVSKKRIALLVNFGNSKLEYKRIIV